jgi:hypothetical protein
VYDRAVTAPERRADLGFRAAAIALVLFFALAQAARWVEPLALDQGLFACFARWIPRGWLPYRDLFDSKPPLFLYSYALARLWPGELTGGIWALEAVWLAATMGVAFAIGRRVWDRWAGLACAALLFVAEWAPGWGGWWSRAQADELVALPMLGAALCAWGAIDRGRERGHELLAWWAGVLVGTAGLFKIPAMALGGAWPLTWFLTGGGVRPAAKRSAWMALGCVVPWALATGWFAAHRALGDFVAGVFVYHRYNAAFISPPWTRVLLEFARTIAVEGALPLTAAAAGLALAGRRERAWLGPWIAFTLAAVVLERQLAGYHYLLALPGLAMAGGFGVARVLRSRSRALVAAAACVVAALVALEGARWSSAYGAGARVLVGRLPRADYLRGFEQGPFSPAAEEAAARMLRERSSPGDGILVWGLSPGIYALSDRHPVTRFPFHKVLMTDAPLSRMMPGLDERRAELVRRLEADPPRFVLVGHHDANGFEPETSFSSMMRFDGLRALLERDYEKDGELGRFVLFRRR